MKSIYSPGDATVYIEAPARLHMGFLDMHGSLGRRFGSIGVAISGIATVLRATNHHQIDINGPGSERVSNCVDKIFKKLDITDGIKIDIEKTIPEHAGLGSGTQLSLATGVAITKLFNKSLTIQQVSSCLDRGNRSGIGIGTFLHGGFIVDAGRSNNNEVPPIVSRLDFPESWRFILVLDHASVGINGEQENIAFDNIPDIGNGAADEVCRIVLMQLLPAIVEQDCKCFGQGLTRIQNITGKYFKNFQGGQFSSHQVECVTNRLLELGATGTGQTSWGPTGFALFGSETDAFQAMKKIRNEYKNNRDLEILICSPRNKKADIQIEEASIKKERFN